MTSKTFVYGSIILLISLVTPSIKINAQTTPEIRPIIFPVIGAVTYYDDFGAPRDGGARLHIGNDLMGAKMMPLFAAVDGTVRVTYPEAEYGYSITIQDKDGYDYNYYHVNNDTPRTDDGKGGGLNAYAVDIDDGARVTAGQLIGWMGDSGNAETTQAHLHFEIESPDGTPFSPYGSLRAAKKLQTPALPYPIQLGEILPYGEFQGGSFISSGNFDTDSENEIVIGAGPTGGPHVKVVNQDGTSVIEFFPYAKNFLGGVDVAAGDVNGDGKADIITAPASRGGPHVKIYDSAGLELGGFMAYDSRFQGGVNVAAADIDGDGKAEIITAPAKNGGPHVRVFKLNGTEVVGFFAYDSSFNGGIDVAAYNANGVAHIVTSPNNGGGPHVKVFNQIGLTTSEFLAYDAGHRGGVRVSIGDMDSNGTPEIVTAPLLGGSQIKSFSLSGANLRNDWGFEEWWPGSWDVAVGRGEVFTSTGPNTKRRTSVREVEFSTRNSRF